MSDKQHLPITEQQNELTVDIDTLSVDEILRRINAEDKKIPGAVEETIPDIARAVELVVRYRMEDPSIISVPAPVDGWGYWTQRNVRRPFAPNRTRCRVSSPAVAMHSYGV